MKQQLCVKISYQKEIQHIICDNCSGSNYEQILAIANERCDVPAVQQSAMMLTNEQGYVFEKRLFEYFLLLFPSPETTFFLRPNWRKLRANATAAKATTPMTPLPTTTSLKRTRSDLGKELAKQQPSDELYVAVPVYRQHCFLGILPSTKRPRLAEDNNANANSNLRRTLFGSKRESLSATAGQAVPKRCIRI